MSDLPNRKQSNCNSSSFGQITNSPESFGWDDSPWDQYSQNLKSKLIELANNKISLSSLFRRFKINLKFKLGSKGWNQHTSCPFIKEHIDSTPSFHYNKNQDRFFCFGCQHSGRAVEFLSFFKGISKEQAAKQLLAELSVDLENLIQKSIDDEIDQDDSKIDDILYDFSLSLREFLYKNNLSASAVQHSEEISKDLDNYLNYKLSSQTQNNIISYNSLRLRIERLKSWLEAYEEE